MDFSWMAWTAPTAIFFAVIFSLIGAMALWERLSPGGHPRNGILGIRTHRGDRLFITLLGAAYIHMAWIVFAPVSLWWALAVSAIYGLLVFRFV